MSIQRDPSIHIKLSQLVRTLKENNIDINLIKVIANTLLEVNELDSISYRANYVFKNLPTKVEKPKRTKIQLVAEPTESEIINFINLLIASKQSSNGNIDSLDHKRLVYDYKHLLSIKTLCLDYCQFFNIEDYKQGCREYIEEAFYLKQDYYSYTIFGYAKAKIYERKNLKIKFEGLGLDKVLLDQYMSLWVSVYTEVFGLDYDRVVLMDIEIRIHFALSLIECIERKVDLLVWLKCQFKAWEFSKKYPPHNQLYGRKALEYYNQYQSEFKTKRAVRTVTETVTSDIDRSNLKDKLSQVIKNDELITY